MRFTDMADELFGPEAGAQDTGGVRLASVRRGGVTVTRVEIARDGLARPRGRYVTIETPSLSLLDERDTALIETAAATGSFRVVSEKGSRLPIHCTSQGKLLLAYLPAAQRRSLLRGCDFAAYTPHSHTDLASLEGEMEQILRQIEKRDRYIFYAHVLDERTFTELAAELGLTYKGVTAAYYRVIHKIRDALRGDEYEF